MNLLPAAVLYISVKTEGKRSFRLWIPLFLFWPLILAVMVLFAPIVLIYSLSRAVRTRKPRMMLLAPRFYSVLCAMRGLSINVRSEKESVRIYIR